MLRILCWSLLIFLSGFRLKAQEFVNLDLGDTTQVHVLETKRGDRFIGKVQAIENNTVIFLFRASEILEFQFSEVERVYAYSGREPWNAFRPTYLSIFPTAYNLPEGVWEYQNNSILWNTLYYGVSDQFSIGGGFVIPAFFTLRLKWTTEVSDRLALGVQNQNLLGLFADAEGSISTFTLMGTWGQPENFLNFGTGLLVSWEFTDELYTVFSLGNGRRFGRRAGIHLVVNVVTGEGETIVFPTGAFNYFGKNNRLSLGVSMETGSSLGIFAAPVLSYNQRF